MTQITKKAIIETFLELIAQHSLDKITVKDIVEKCGINRNTFYYYYQDIYDLIDDVFAMETKRVLEEQKKSDVWHEELQRVALFVVENKAAIAHIYYSKSRDVLERYLFAITDMIIKDYVDRQRKTLSVSEENSKFICAFYSYSLVGMTLSWIKDGMQENSEQFLRKVAAIFENTVHIALESSDSLDEQ